MEKAAVAVTSAASVFPQDQDVAARLANIHRRMAQNPADEGYRAFAAGDYKTAVRTARQAIEFAPDVMSYRLLLLFTFLADGSLSDALATAVSAVQLDPNDYVPRVWSGYIRQRMGDHAGALTDFKAASSISGLTPNEARAIRLIAADAALSAKNPSEALDWLKELDRSDPLVAIRLGDAEGALSQRGTLTGDGKTMPMPVQDCRATPYGSVCSLDAPVVASRLVTEAAPSAGYVAASEAYTAQREHNYKLAITDARKAVEAEPGIEANRLLLINLLIAAGQADAAEREATRAIEQGFANPTIFAQRGYARQSQHNLSGAIADWETALKRGLSAKEATTVRLALADAALTRKQPRRALAALTGLPDSYDSAIRRAYALQALGEKDAALAAFDRAERMAPSAEKRDGALKARISILVELNRKEEARALLDDAIAKGRLRTISEADRGYLAVQVGNDKLALSLFDDAANNGRLPPRTTFDAGYTAMRQFENQKAIAYLKQGIDANLAGELDVDPQRLFEVRRTVADLSREWGVNTAVFFSKVGAAPNPFGLPITGSGTYTSQVGSEFYYRPEEFGNRNGSLFDIFGRLFDTLYDQSGGPTGVPTVQGMVGARWKPLSDQNLILEADKLFRVGNEARDDTLLRIAYSYLYGGDLRAVETTWRTWQVYAEADKYLQHPELVAAVEGRFGQSFRLDPISRDLVLFPHLVVAANYDDAYAVPQAFGAGGGAALRYWFGETKYSAPPSYLELTVQYRFRLAGDKRAQGIYAYVALNY